MVAEQPRSTKELAELLRLSDSAVSRHLRILAGAGVVEGERDGYFVLYRLKPDRIGQLGGALRRTLGLAQTGGTSMLTLPVNVAREREMA
jgi:DNA-binding transcriptional ArsR family regulator